MKKIKLQGKRLKIYFPYDPDLVEIVRELPDRKFEEPKKSPKYWWIPATEWHLDKAIEALPDFEVDKSTLKLRENGTREWRGEIKLPVTELKLRDFQINGVVFAWERKGRVIIGDDPGLGKTPQSLAYLHVERSKIGKVLIVAPASVVYKWEYEIDRWIKWSRSVIPNGSVRLNGDMIHVMSYAIMRSRYRELIGRYDTVIFDEAHKLKNPDSKQSISARLITDRAERVLMLTGTAFKNRPKELFNLINILRPDLFPNFFKFALRYCNAQKTDMGWDFNGSSNEKELRERLGSVMIRRLKAEVLNELPDLSRVVIPVDIPNWGEYLDARRLLFTERANPLAQITTLRQVIGKGKAEVGLQWAKDFLDDSPTEKLVVFCHHKEVVDRMELGLQSYGVQKVVGDVSQSDRRDAIDRFQNNPYVRVMVLSSAGGEGIDLWRASNILFVERMWTPADEEQIEARLHRMGQKNAVVAYYLRARRTMDEYMDELITAKRKVFDRVLTAPDVSKEIMQEVYKLMIEEGE